MYGTIVVSSPAVTNASSGNTDANFSNTIHLTPQTTTPPFIACVNIVPDGDVMLHVSAGYSSRRYLVYSQVLCGTSTVFRNMLGRHSVFSEAVALRESQQRDSIEPVVVTLHGDDLDTIGIILYVLHGQNKKVPRRLSIERLAKVSIICDKYGWHEGLQVSAGVWTDMLRSKTKSHAVDWLLISWVFGPEEVFMEVTRDLMLGEISDNEDGILFGKQQLLLADCIPSAVSDKLVEGRERWVNLIRTHVENIQQTYLSEDNESIVVCSRGLNAKQCDAMQLGHLYRSLLASAGLYSDSVFNITSTIKKIPGMKFDMFDPEQSYCPCGTRFPSARHTCAYTDAHCECGWVSTLREVADECLEMCNGLVFAEFPSRTW
ncbi:hypothetical protein BDD12DRAFT_983294 [Trichophaea hybrida]|nr:hypothetical protein BDD12DRAFT_983294 [Trichophaea hybrida]